MSTSIKIISRNSVDKMVSYSTRKDGLLELMSQSFLFPAGEVGIKLNVNNLRFKYDNNGTVTLITRIKTGNDLMELLLTKDAVERFVFPGTKINLFLPYIPYARQDRVCVDGEPFSLKVFANLINSCKFNSVTVVDPHSDVVGGVFDNINIISQFDVIKKDISFSGSI